MHHMCAHTKKIAEQGPLALATTPGDGKVGAVQGVLCFSTARSLYVHMEIILLWKFPYMVIRQHALWAG